MVVVRLFVVVRVGWEWVISVSVVIRLFLRSVVYLRLCWVLVSEFLFLFILYMVIVCCRFVM